MPRCCSGVGLRLYVGGATELFYGLAELQCDRTYDTVRTEDRPVLRAPVRFALDHFYRAIHCALLGIATVSRPSVCL